MTYAWETHLEVSMKNRIIMCFRCCLRGRPISPKLAMELMYPFIDQSHRRKLRRKINYGNVQNLKQMPTSKATTRML